MSDSLTFIPIYFDNENALRLLNDSDRGQLLLALIDYAKNKNIPDTLSPASMMAFMLMSGAADRYARYYASNSANGKKGGAPKGNQNASKQANNNQISSGYQAENNQNTSKKQAIRQDKTNTKTKDNDKTNTKDALDQAIDYFKEHRKKLKKEMTDHAVDLLRKKLEELAPNDKVKQAELVDYAITKGWQSVYMPDEKDRKPQGYKPQEQKPQPKPRTFVLTEDGGLKYDDEP